MPELWHVTREPQSIQADRLKCLLISGTLSSLNPRPPRKWTFLALPRDNGHPILVNPSL